MLKVVVLKFPNKSVTYRQTVLITDKVMSSAPKNLKQDSHWDKTLIELVKTLIELVKNKIGGGLKNTAGVICSLIWFIVMYAEIKSWLWIFGTQ